MSGVTVSRKTTITVSSNDIKKMLVDHFKAPETAWVDFVIVDYGDTLDCAQISWTVEDVEASKGKDKTDAE